MSYILDAVRKAEEERRQSQSPGVRSLAAQGMPQRNQGNRKYWVIGFLVLLFNSALWFLVNRDKADSVVNEAPVQAPVIEKSSAPPELKSGQATALHSPAIEEKKGRSHDAVQRVKLWQASAGAQTAINALDFSFHVYSTDSIRRTIIINGQRMREGDRISDALILENITEVGVLLRYENLLVEVEILEQW